MKSYLLDTDVIIDYFKNQSKAVNLFTQLQENANFVISVLTISELRAGWHSSEAKEKLEELYAIAEVISVTPEIAELGGELRYEYRKKGTKLPTVDTLIAATCIRNSYCLITRNLKDYPMPELEMYKDTYK